MYQIERFEKEIAVEDYLEGYVNVGEFLEACRQCPNYTNSWACPPLPFSPESFWQQFDRFYIIARKLSFPAGTSQEEGFRQLKRLKGQMSEELFQLEKSWPGSRALSAGSCAVCEEGCTRAEGKPCRHPEQMRYSIEALGGNVGLTVSKLMGIRLEWMEEGKLPPYFVLVGGLLKKDEIAAQGAQIL